MLIMPDRDKVIAVIDDEPRMLKAIVRLLNANGYATQAFPSAEAFLAGSAASEVACLILDIDLGGMSGIGLRRRLSELGLSLPVIFITAIEDDAVQRDAMASGCIAYLRKPFPAGLLIGAIKEATG
jgi:FixJ family two-component response regulator